MNKYIYSDHSKEKATWVNGTTVYPIIFECEAENILEADKALEVTLGIKVVKMSHIFVEIKWNG
jgi:hypothetical protein